MRIETLKEPRANPEVDVLIIGGGVNGIATFRDLVLQNIKVLLVEKITGATLPNYVSPIQIDSIFAPINIL